SSLYNNLYDAGSGAVSLDDTGLLTAGGRMIGRIVAIRLKPDRHAGQHGECLGRSNLLLSRVRTILATARPGAYDLSPIPRTGAENFRRDTRPDTSARWRRGTLSAPGTERQRLRNLPA